MRPPTFARWLLRTLLPKAHRAVVLADLDEDFARVQRKRSAAAAACWYRRQVFASVPGAVQMRARSIGVFRLPGAFNQDARRAWRNLRFRGWRLVLAAGLLAVALAANTLVFAAADSLVFHRAPYRNVEQLVEIRQRDARTGEPGDSHLSPALLDEWRNQHDLLAGVEGHLSKTIFLSGAGEPAMVDTADVTVGLIRLLGARPRWGRDFVEDDARQTSVQPALIAETLAIDQFGDAGRAVGQTLQTTAEPLRVVGVMPRSFRFPSGDVRVWRALDPRGPLGEGSVGVSSIARLAPDMDLRRAAGLLEQRSEGVGRAAGTRQGYSATATPLRSAQAALDQRRMLLVLLGAALSLLLIACANVASLELAGAVTRARTYAIEMAVGASRGALIRSALMEGALLVSAAAIGAAVLSRVGAKTLVAFFPPYILNGSANPIDIDDRAMLFMTAIAALAWALSALPTAGFAGRANLVDLLKLEGTSVVTSRGGTRWRSGLTVAQVAFAVLLLVGTVLYVRSYAALLRLDKGFDSAGVVSISLTIPPQALGTTAERRVLAETLLARIRARPGVVAAFEGSPPPSTGDSPTMLDQIEVDDRGPAPANLLFPKLTVEPDYFTVLRIPLMRGRMFEAGEPTTSVIISEALAARLWPGQDAVGHRFRGSPGRPWYSVVGVAGHVRLTADGTTGPTRLYQLYFAKQPPPVPRPVPPTPPSRQRDMSNFYRFMTITARVDSRSRTSDLYQTVRGVEPRNILKLQFVDDLYADQFADRLLATRLIGGFGVLAFLVATAGIYSLMAFLVASRAREMGIRVALGASGGDIRRLVLGSSLRLVATGGAIGIASSLVLSRWVQSQLFGVSPTDPLTLTMVTVGVVAVSLLATWYPARQAARVHPRELLNG